MGYFLHPLCCVALRVVRMYISKAMAQFDPDGSGRDLYLDKRREAHESPHSGMQISLCRPGPSPDKYHAPMHGRSDPPPHYQPCGSGRDMYQISGDRNPLNQSKPGAGFNASPFRDGQRPATAYPSVVYLEDAVPLPGKKDFARRRAARSLRRAQFCQSSRLSRPKSRVGKYSVAQAAHGKSKKTIFSSNRMLECFALGMPVQ